MGSLFCFLFIESNLIKLIKKKNKTYTTRYFVNEYTFLVLIVILYIKEKSKLIQLRIILNLFYNYLRIKSNSTQTVVRL